MPSSIRSQRGVTSRRRLPQRKFPGQSATNAFKALVDVQIFAKAPVPGQVKTRLQPLLGDAAAELHAELVRDLVRRLATLPARFRLQLWATDHATQCFYASLLRQYPRLRWRRQVEGNLGQRMLSSLERTSSAAATVIVGTDCAVLTAAHVSAAARWCALAPMRSYFVPAEDGGYVLSAHSGVHPRMFDNIAWSTSEVLQQAHEQHWRCGFTLAQPAVRLWDIDTPMDYLRYRRYAESINNTVTGAESTEPD